ncbi:MAG: DUF4838 domain-containing protein, partial [Candidatus Aminicenantes bacterium]|nr:DUF4838 domain-containing protein [Candidatus Aminicenantes bacterium]
MSWPSRPMPVCPFLTGNPRRRLDHDENRIRRSRPPQSRPLSCFSGRVFSRPDRLRTLQAGPRVQLGVLVHLRFPVDGRKRQGEEAVSVSALAAVLGTALFLAGDPSGPLLVIIDGGSTSYRIVVSAQAPETDLRAAQELQSHLWKISGAVVPVVSDASPPGRDEILVGRSRRYAQAGIDIPWDGLAEDGFVLRTVGRRLVIAGGRDKGSLYGVYAFLEDVLGCRKYTASAMIVPRTSTVAVGPLDKTEVPAFAFREVSLPEAFDDAFADWHKLDNRAARAREWGLWVHTFEVFIPAGKHFETHPEYFTEWNGRRIPHGQLCLSNPDVLRIVIEELGRRIREKPEAKFWSVSQNDAFLPCQCSSCRSLEEETGGPSGAILWFVNQVARAFPDKVISTLAYQYSRPAPRNIEPE